MESDRALFRPRSHTGLQAVIAPEPGFAPAHAALAEAFLLILGAIGAGLGRRRPRPALVFA